MSKYKPYNLKDVNEASSQNKFNVISTFVGGGGSSTGYRLAGGKILCINEFVEEAQNTYKENYPDTPILPGDIKKLTAKDFTDIAGTTDIDILDGSPCSTFSVDPVNCHILRVVNIQMVGDRLKSIQMV